MNRLCAIFLFLVLSIATAYPKDFVIIDLDGTLATLNYRQGKLEKARLNGVPEKQAFAEFLNPEFIKYDEVSPQMIDLLLYYKSKGYGIFLLSGRKEFQLAATKEWLATHNIPYDKLQLQEKDSKFGDLEFKKNAYLELVKNGDTVWAAFDDQIPVVNLWRGLGIYTYDVEGADYINKKPAKK